MDDDIAPGGAYTWLPTFDGLDATKLAATVSNRLTWDLAFAGEHKVDGIHRSFLFD